LEVSVCGESALLAAIADLWSPWFIAEQKLSFAAGGYSVCE
jgi:hypothetical protein